MPPIRKQNSTLSLSISLVIVFGFSAAVIWLRIAVVKSTYDFVRQEKELHSLQDEVQKLRLQWLKVTNSRRLESIAKTLGLVPPAIHQTLRYTAAAGNGKSHDRATPKNQ